MSELNRTVGKRIRKYRKAIGLTQEQLAEKCRLHPAYIGQLERGEKNATLNSIQTICVGLHIPMEQLLSGITSETADSNVPMSGQIMDRLADLSDPELHIIYNMINMITDTAERKNV